MRSFVVGWRMATSLVLCLPQLCRGVTYAVELHLPLAGNRRGLTGSNDRFMRRSPLAWGCDC